MAALSLRDWLFAGLERLAPASAADLTPQTSGLPLRSRDYEAVENLGHLDLARQAGIRPHVVAEIEHVLFHGRWRTDLLAPRFVDIDVAGRARAGAAAFGLDPGDSVLDRCLHHGRSRLRVD